MHANKAQRHQDHKSAISEQVTRCPSIDYHSKEPTICPNIAYHHRQDHESAAINQTVHHQSKDCIFEEPEDFKQLLLEVKK